MFSLCCTQKWQQCLKPSHVCFPTLTNKKKPPVHRFSEEWCLIAHAHIQAHIQGKHPIYCSFEGISTKHPLTDVLQTCNQDVLCTQQLLRASFPPSSVHEYFMFSLSKSDQGYYNADTQQTAILTSLTTGTIILLLDYLFSCQLLTIKSYLKVHHHQ